METSYYKCEAEYLGLKFQLIMDNVSQISNRKTKFNVWKSGTDLDGKGSLHLAGNKKYCYDLFKKAGIPVPRYKILKSGDFFGAVSFFREIKKPIVIKPARDTGDSSGVFVKLENSFSIFIAVSYVKIFGNEMIVEEFIDGDNFRLLFCCGEFLSACERIPSFVICDGQSSIKQLIDKENQKRLEIGDLKPFDPDTRPILYKIKITKSLKNFIRKQGYNLNSIPQKGIKVNFQPICHWYQGGSYYDVTDKIDQNFVEMAKKAVELAGVKLAGVDLITSDIENYQRGRCVINEINTTPGLLIHYEVQNQEKRIPVIRIILKKYFNLEGCNET
ncbi:MAG: ATP-grasp domain-containing protein [Desulforegulaceae bacterium]|nr:ATP-grasp domain-containing protein [Desulforegulaceae bacterium]